MSLPKTLLLFAALCTPLAAQDFVHWEVPHVTPLALTGDGGLLLAVNTADHHLEIFDATGPRLVQRPSVPVGLAPVSVRLHGDSEAWVVNHVSDSISIVDLDAPGGPRVVRTLDTDDEPTDVVFAGLPERAFVSCSQVNTLMIFDLATPGAPPRRVPILGEDPRAMAVSADGREVYLAVFESGNGTTTIGGPGLGPGGFPGQTFGEDFPPNFVADPTGPYAGVSPPPNDGANFTPAMKAGNPAPPESALIVRKTQAGVWRDDNGGDWTRWVSGPKAAETGRLPGWDLPDRDLAVIDTGTESVAYVTRLMNICMALAVNPVSGRVLVVGTEATNDIRFEPNLNGTFVRVFGALVNPASLSRNVRDLNLHLDYTTSTIPVAQRESSIGDPRGVVFRRNGQRGFVTGMGSNNVVVIGGTGQRLPVAPIEVAEGPTGIVLDENTGRGFVLGRFESAISIIDIDNFTELDRVSFFDATPEVVRAGRPLLYDTHRTSGLGQLACGSCHVDARMDRLAWDLGNPAGDVKTPAGQNLAGSVLDPDQHFNNFHPMKGPMTTQTLQDIIGMEPLHWSGDKDGLEEFNGAYTDLQGDDTQLTAQEMQQFEDFLATIAYPPNPFRPIDNSLPTALTLNGHFTTGAFSPPGQPLPVGDAVRGLELYRPPNLTAGSVACVSCHTLPTGMGPDMVFESGQYMEIPAGPMGERHHMLVSKGFDGSTRKVPQLRNLHEKVGFDTTQVENLAGFGFLHDGSVDSLARFIGLPPFNIVSDQDTADIIALMLSFAGSDLPLGNQFTLLEGPGSLSLDTHAGVGRQITVEDANALTPEQGALLLQMLALADDDAVGMIVKTLRNDETRGYVYVGDGQLLSDRATETVDGITLLLDSTPGAESTWTLVAKGTETRLGVDRDGDGYYDRDELDAGTDPRDAQSFPVTCETTVEDLGFGLAGFGGVAPGFTVCGTLASGGQASFKLEDARPSANALLVLGLVAANQPFKGGVLVPPLTLTIGPLSVGGDGSLTIGPVGVGGGPLDVYAQWIVKDADGPLGFALSNALRLQLLP